MHKLFKTIATFLIVIELISSCAKSSGDVIAPTSVNIVNAVTSSPGIIPVFGTSGPIQYFASAQTIFYQSSQLYSPLSGPNSLYIVENTDTTLDAKSQLFNGTLKLSSSGIYTLFVTGDTTKTDTLFVWDNIPAYNDSSAGIRLVNLTQGNSSLNVNLKGNDPATQQEFSNLGYKGISAFKRYAVGDNVGGAYNFVIHNQITGDSLQFTWNYTLFKNNTIVITGADDPSGITWTSFQVNNY